MSDITALEYFGGDELPASVFDKYRDFNTEKNPDQRQRKMAKEFARIEKKKFKKPLSEEFIYECFKNFGYIIPQGSILSGLANPNYVTLSNCYVLESPTDSYGGILSTDEQIVQISKRRGGVGIDISNIRPDKFPTTNASRTSTGIVPFCERYSNSIREVGQNGRRGALMLTVSVHHPQVLDFAEMKLDGTKVTGANISVRLTNEFLQAVKDGTDYEQRFPVNVAPDYIYEGLRIEKPFRRMVDAREVWKRIIHCAWERAEPGLLFWDRIISESPADCYRYLGFETISTNPCGELPLCALDSCRLLVLNLFSFVVNPFTKEAYFDFEKFKKYAQIAQRLMDDIIDLELECIDRIIGKIEKDPESIDIKARELAIWKKIREKCYNGRRTGTGITALGDAIAALGIKYGSDESIEITSEIYRVLKLSAYRCSVDIAKESGPFPIFDSALEQHNPFLLRIKDEDPELYADMQKYGRANIALLTTAPVGSISTMGGPTGYWGTTSGIEPLFTDVPYTRRKKINPTDPGEQIPDFIDELGDKWKHYDVYHAKIKMWMDITGETDYTKSPYYGATADKIDWKARVKLQAAATRHIDHSISSTVNLPKGATEEDVAEIYLTAWQEGCKGITVYRDGCRTGVLVEKQEVKLNHAKKRPQTLPCDVYRFRVKKQPFTVLVGIMDNAPYEVFAFHQDELNKVDVKTGIIHKIKRGKYELRDDEGVNLFKGETLSEQLSDDEAAITRLVSTSLRHNAPLEFVVHQLEKASGGLDSLSIAISRGLKKYIKDGAKVSGEVCEGCGSESLARQEGCVKCLLCGWSKC